jgi:hypothetical protein
MVEGSIAVENHAMQNETANTITNELPRGRSRGTPFAAAKVRATAAIAFRITSAALDGSTNR